MIMWSHKINKKLKTESKTAEEKSHPGGSTCLAFNARTEHGPGAERRKQATSWRLNARQMLLQGVIFLLLFLILFLIFLFIL